MRNRREFLQQSMFAAATMAAASASTPRLFADEVPDSKSAADRLTVAVVGVRGRGTAHIGAFQGRKDSFIKYVVDVDKEVGNTRAEEIGKKQDIKPTFVEDLRKVLEDKTVDVVSIATPNHWHALGAIWAIQAGKDVYVEKPVSHNVSEGRRIVQAARKHGRICQTGTQSRSNPGLREAVAFIKEGKIGEVKVARGLCYKRRGSIGPKGTYQVPSNVNYDLWCGPAPMDPLTRKNLHYDWHWVWSTGNGDLGNQGIHQMDIARWGLGVNEISSSVMSYGGRLGYEDAGECANTQIVVHNYGAKSLVFEVRGLETKDYRGANVGVIFEGTDGYVVCPTYDSATAFDKDGNKIKTFSGGADHFANFVKAVRSRKVEDLNADILEGHLSSALCHLGNISYRLGTSLGADAALKKVEAVASNDNAKDTFERTLKHLADNKVDPATVKIQVGDDLALDPASETFTGNQEAANKMLTREYRAPYVVPAADKV
ncbi:MAG: Gfo/Idh/MocA family protein [Planctomycetaceae bacterium]